MIRRTAHALADTAVANLDDYVAADGLSGLAIAHAQPPIHTIDLIEAAGLRGRGGAGFPTGRKWRGIAGSIARADDAFVVVNAAEGEPGTFKDRALLRADPYIVLEGALVAAHCTGASRIVVATKASYTDVLGRIRTAIAELDAAGALAGVTVDVIEGPDHYLFGEETALLEVVEGEDPLPRHLPPYLYGLFSTSPNLGWSAGNDVALGRPTQPGDNPVLVNNAETFAHAALICRHGADWYRSMGTVESPGPAIVTITGDVERAVVAEIELGQPLGDVIDYLTGGPRAGRTIKAVLSGVSNEVLTPDRLDTPITYETLRAAGAGLGSAGFIVYDDRRNMVDVAYQVSRFLHVESCGQCNPCKTGTHDITAALERLVIGRGTRDDMAAIGRRLGTVTDGARCFLPTQEQRLVASLLDRYPADLAHRLGGAPGDLDLVLPKLVDLADGVARCDPRAAHKRPDWTYAETPVRMR